MERTNYRKSHLTKADKSSIIGEGPFVLVNFNLPDLKNKFQRYVSWFTSITIGELKFCCLDCKPTFVREILNLEDHLAGTHGFQERKCCDKSCVQTAFFCRCCLTLMISTCSDSLSRCPIPEGYRICRHRRLLDDVFSFIPVHEGSSRWVYCLDRLGEHLMDSIFKCTILSLPVSGWCGLCNINFKCYSDLSLHVSLLRHSKCNRYSDMILFFCCTCFKINLLRDSNYPDTRLDVCGGCGNQVFSQVYQIYLNNKLNVSSSFSRTTRQLQSLPDAFLKNNFSGQCSLIEVTILSSWYQEYKLCVPWPCDTEIDYVCSSAIYKDVTLDSLLGEDTVAACRVKEFDCLICNKLLVGLEELCRHAGEEKHRYRCYLATRRKVPIPYMIYCDVCSLGVISLKAYNLEKHFSSTKHLSNLCPTDDIHAYQGDSLWLRSNPSQESLEMLKSEESVNMVVDELQKKSKESLDNFERIKEELRQQVLQVLQPHYPLAKLYFYDISYLSWANRRSSSEVFVDLDDNYLTVVKDPKETTKRLFDIFKKEAKNFTCDKLILKTYIPFVVVWHEGLEQLLLINCYNGLPIEKFKLYKFFLDFDQRTNRLLTVIMKWGIMNKIVNVKKPLSCQTTIFWMVVFFLMQSHIAILPTVQLLKSLYEGKPYVLNGWDFSVCLDIGTVKSKFKTFETSSSLSLKTILMEFFKFYSTIETDKVFLCPLTGKVVPTSVLLGNHSVYVDSEGRHKAPKKGYFERPICILDPIEFDFFVSHDIEEGVWKHFQYLCRKTLACSQWFKE